MINVKLITAIGKKIYQNRKVFFLSGKMAKYLFKKHKAAKKDYLLDDYLDRHAKNFLERFNVNGDKFDTIIAINSSSNDIKIVKQTGEIFSISSEYYIDRLSDFIVAAHFRK